EVPWRTDHARRREERAPRGAPEPRKTIVADADYRQPRRHAPFSIVRFRHVDAGGIEVAARRCSLRKKA
ncbi:hypothetical protein G3N57_37855, partial [Paraburkholderia sp. Se-20369]|nr:hypothetical protein [Paraburkholderia sp. Se-20369]